jgi:cellulose biosynthesis protein BcsQ
VVDMTSPSGPGVIVVAEPDVHALLVESGGSWRVQERQAAVTDMWQALSAGRLDQHSRILVFSDSLAQGTAGEEAELAQTAAAIVAMANAGARVFVATSLPESQTNLVERIAAAARAQGIDPSVLAYHLLPMAEGDAAVLDRMRTVLGPDVVFPLHREDEDLERAAEPVEPEAAVERAAWPVEPETAVEPEPMAPEPAPEAAPVPPAAIPPAAIPLATAPPGLPPIGIARGGSGAPPPLPATGTAGQTPPAASGYPPNASMELLGRPKRPGQVTITVTSSKGGSGKSTASILLAGSIARASADAGAPLSVCLIDLDTRDGQVASLIGKFMPTALNIRVQPVWDEERIRRNLVHADGLDIDTLLAPIRPRTADTVGPDFYRTIVRSLQRMFDVVVMDTSVQYLEPLIADVALGESDEILFVTTLASTAVQGMARALREITAPTDESGLGIPREKIGIIVNQSVANVGMERDQVLAAGLGVPVVGVIPLATKDVLTATNLNRMYALLDHPLIGPAYNELARACLPGRELTSWRSTTPAEGVPAPVSVPAGADAVDVDGKRRGLFRR